ncbi:hypothetical protein AAFN90_16120 [Erwiniaceae bacterium CAU 1747]
MRKLWFAVWCVFSFILSYLIFFLLITFIQVNIIPREMLENFLELLSMTGDQAYTRWLCFSGGGLSLLLAIMTGHEVWALQHHAEA